MDWLFRINKGGESCRTIRGLKKVFQIDTRDSGASGADGDSGAPRADGDSGASGADGDSGATRADGDSEATGADGDSGATGADGDSGATGDSGAIGADGVNILEQDYCDPCDQLQFRPFGNLNY